MGGGGCTQHLDADEVQWTAAVIVTQKAGDFLTGLTTTSVSSTLVHGSYLK